MYAALKFYKCSTPKLQPLIAVLSMKGSEPEWAKQHTMNIGW